MHAIMRLKHLPLIPLLLGSCALAARMHEDAWGTTIRLDEPVVSRTVANAKEGTPQDMGLDLFEVTGDPEHRPQVRWVDQNRLSIQPAKGASVATEYCLAFKPGVTYLSGRELEQREFRFHAPNTRLLVREPQWGLPQPGLIVTPFDDTTKEALEFSAESPVEYTFVHEGGRRRVPGKAQPLRLKHSGSPRLQLEQVHEAGPDSVLPASVLVVPEEPLPDGSKWRLEIKPAPDSGLCNFADPYKFTACTELRTDVAAFLEKTEKEGDPATHTINVAFAANVTRATAEKAFQDLEICIGGARSVNTRDGMGKTVSTPQGTYTFTFDGLLESERESTIYTGGPHSYNPAVDNPAVDAQGFTWSYRAPDAVQGFRLRANAPAPALAELTVKAGIAAKLGLPVTRDHTHRINLTPAWPAVDLTGTDYRETYVRLPYNGEHKLRLRSVNNCGLTATAYRWDAENVPQVADTVAECLNNNADAMQKHRLAVIELQKQAGLAKEVDLAQVEQTQQRATELHMRNAERLQEAYAKAQKFRTLQIPADETGFCDTGEHVLDLDALTGGNTRPGLYVVALEIKPGPAALAAAAQVGVDERDLTLHTEFAVQVSDLQLAGMEEARMLLVSDRQTGGPVAAGTVAAWKTGDKSAEFPVENGMARLELPTGAEKLCADWLMVRSGGDYLLMERGLLLADPLAGRETETALCRAEVFCDNNLYRPGDTVHVRGVIRNCGRSNNTSLPQLNEATLTVTKPSGRIWKEETLTVDEFGCVACDFTLPDGEEDVTGPYRVRLSSDGKELGSCRIRAEVFRRDSFKFEAACALKRVSPTRAKLCIKAVDLNGAPLSNAKLHYKLSTDVQTDCPETVDARLNAQGCYERIISLSPKEGETGNAHYLRLENGTITNDREEVRRFDCFAKFYNADFRVLRRGDTVRLHPAQWDGESQEVLARDQKLHLVIKGKDVVERKELPNGFTGERRAEVTVWEGDITVPANSKHGFGLGLEKHIDDYRKEHPGASLHVLRLFISGTDPDGHSFTDSESFWWYGSSGKETVFTLTASPDKRSCTLNSDVAGTAYAFVCSGKGNIRALTIPVERGEHPVDLKLTPQETGSLDVLVVMPAAEDSGVYSRYLVAQARLDIPALQRKLEVKLDLPAEACSPGAQVKLAGCVTLPDGSPATSAVTFYAVDEGMLSVSGDYRLPNLEQAFSYEPSSMFFNPRNGGYATIRRRFYRPAFMEPMAGVWRGECLSCGHERFAQFIGRSVGYGLGAGGAGRGGAAAGKTHGGVAVLEDDGSGGDTAGDDGDTQVETQTPRLRTNFVPVALWQASLPVDAQGRFETTCTLPDTLTTYRVFAVAVDQGGNRFGGAEGSLQVTLPVMITPGTPFFMSTGDKLLLPLTITNNTDKEGTWKVKLDATADTREIRLAAHSTGTLKFEVEARREGTCTLNWTAIAKNGSDAVQGTFPVRFPAPLLKETHHLVLQKRGDVLKPASLLAPELAESTRGELEVDLSANPLLLLAGCMDFVLDYPYGCTEQTATGLLPWLLYDRLAPVCPRMAETPPDQARKLVEENIEKLLKRQKDDGGLGYWDDSKGSHFWASAHAAYVLDMAAACGYKVPEDKMDALRDYLQEQVQGRYDDVEGADTRFQVARVLGDRQTARQTLARLVREETQMQEKAHRFMGPWYSRSVLADLRFIYDMEKEPAKRHKAFIAWLRARGHDYRHATTWQSAWTFIALHEYLRREPKAKQGATVTAADGSKLTLDNGITTIPLAKRGDTLGNCPASYSRTRGTAYAVVRAKAQPNCTEYPGVTEKGLQITRLYEKRDADGVWRPARDFNVGDVVRVTLTCAKVAAELEYFVLEDYLPACMEAINPAIKSQCAGLEPCSWSPWFDHKEYLADRVRGFCTKWGGRDLLNMRYYARVKRAGISTAPPAQAQLMYEPQTHGLSPNAVIHSK